MISEKEYFEEELEKLNSTIEKGNLISLSIGRQIVDHRRAIATRLSTQLAITCVSLRAIADHGKTDLFLDYHSMSSLSRTCIESAAMLFYIGDIDCNEDEWFCRKWVLDLHDIHKRRLILKFVDSESYEDKFKENKEYVINKLQKNEFFLNLEYKRRKKLLKGGDLYVYCRKAAFSKIGLSEEELDISYKLFSQNIHATSFTFIGAEERGIFEPQSKYSYYRAGFALEIATKIGSLANEHMLRLFPLSKKI